MKYCSISDCRYRYLAKGYCSTHYKRWRKHGDPLYGETLADRLWNKVNKTDFCWLWTGKIQNLGYGEIWAGGGLVLVHRLAHELLKGPIPEHLEIDHLCRTRNCVNPSHLDLVDRVENVRRMHLTAEEHFALGHH